MKLPFSNQVEAGRVPVEGGDGSFTIPHESGDPFGQFAFVLPSQKASVKTVAIIVIAAAACQEGEIDMPWDHVSVHIREFGRKGGKKTQRMRCPSWAEMCTIKELFFESDEVVMQLHPKEEDYVNLHPHVLHLWRPTEQEIPTPPIHAV